MSNDKLKYFDILAAKQAYFNGSNVTELLRRQKNSRENTPEIIEVAYDLQAGTYIESVESNLEKAGLYVAELSEILDRHLEPGDTLLDIGTGELTTLSLVAENLANKPENIFAFDISWSRIYKGLSFARKTMNDDFERLVPFVADINEIPLLDKSVSITTSSHALEPNGGKLIGLMSELFRVTSKKLVLFEPCYEINSREGKERMDRLGYIKDIDGVIERLGGKLVEKVVIRNISNPLNPTVCFVINPPGAESATAPGSKRSGIFSVPGTNWALEDMGDFFFSNQTGLAFPKLKTIPVLKSNAAILASALTG